MNSLNRVANTIQNKVPNSLYRAQDRIQIPIFTTLIQTTRTKKKQENNRRKELQSGRRVPPTRENAGVDIIVPPGRCGAPSEYFFTSDQDFLDIINNNASEIHELNKINNLRDFCQKVFDFWINKLNIQKAGIKINLVENLPGGEVGKYTLQNNTITINIRKCIPDLKHVQIVNSTLEHKSVYFATILHELNHFLQFRNILFYGDVTGNMGQSATQKRYERQYPHQSNNDGKISVRKILFSSIKDEQLKSYILQNFSPLSNLQAWNIGTQEINNFWEYAYANQTNNTSTYANSTWEKECRRRQKMVQDAYETTLKNSSHTPIGSSNSAQSTQKQSFIQKYDLKADDINSLDILERQALQQIILSYRNQEDRIKKSIIDYILKTLKDPKYANYSVDQFVRECRNDIDLILESTKE